MEERHTMYIVRTYCFVGGVWVILIRILEMFLWVGALGTTKICRPTRPLCTLVNLVKGLEKKGVVQTLPGQRKK